MCLKRFTESVRECGLSVSFPIKVSVMYKVSGSVSQPRYCERGGVRRSEAERR